MRKFIVAMCLLVAGCSSSPSPPKRIDVERIFIDGGYVKLVVRNEDGGLRFEDYLRSTNVIIKDDVDDDEKSWVIVDENGIDTVTEIHIHNLDELDGGKRGGKHPKTIHELE